MKKISVALFICVFLALAVSPLYAGVETFQLSTEVRIYDPELAYNGYTLFTRGLTGTSNLIDMEGNLVHQWDNAGGYKLLPNGNLFSGFGQTLYERDWDNNIVWPADGVPWNFSAERKAIDNASIHHDSWKIHNAVLDEDTYISLFYYSATNEQIWAAGGDPAIDYEAARRNTNLDGIVEVDRNGQILWEWHFLDHTVQDQNDTWPNYGVIAENPGKVDVFWRTDEQQPNGPAGVVRDWMHCNSLQYNPNLGHIVVNSKHWSTFYVIDHSGTFVSDRAAFDADPDAALAANMAAAASDAGDFIYRFGNPSAYKQGDAPTFENEGNQQMYGSHNIHWLENDLPGDPEGTNFLIFNNDCYDPLDNFSEVLEINPYLNAAGTNTGSYVNPPDAGYIGNGTSIQIVWSFRAGSNNSFYSNFISGIQRVANGNTVVCSGAHGHFFEVTPTNRVVWEYINPYSGSTPRKVVGDSRAPAPAPASVFRVQRYGPDYPGLAGKDLSALGPITESTVSGALDNFRESKAGFAGNVVIIPGGGDPYGGYPF